MSQTIEILVSPKGQTTLQTRGFAGPSCRPASQDLERALGIVVQDQPTAELYQSASQAASLQQQTGR